MKIFLRISVLLLISCATALAEPETMTHQGILTSPDGTPLDTIVSMTFKLYNNVDSPAPFWSEIQSVTVTNGLYDVALGTVTAFPADFLNDGTTWLGITVGADSEMLPRRQLRSVPFAFRVRTVDDASGGDIAGDVLIRGKLTVGNFNTNTGTQAFVSGNWNTASGDYATCLGHDNHASGYHATVSGGRFNSASGDFSVIAGGGDIDTIDGNSAEGNLSTIGGGYRNNAAGDASTIAGGYYHTASGGSATIGGGYRNTSTASYSTVGGGTYNDATGLYATIAGGRYNDVAGNRSSIGGGDINEITSGSDYSTLAGGHDNHVTGDYSTIAGGDSNAIYGPASYAAVGGGRVNQVRGDYSVIPGGTYNTITGDYSLGCGSHVNVSAHRAFVFGDGSETFSIGMSNTANFLCRNGFRIWTDSLLFNAGTRLAPGGSSWIALSDSAKKTNRIHADGNSILERISAMPIDQWNYKHQPDGPEHIGPMAQDFWNAFHLGTDSLGIETLDADGVLFAAVKELIKRNSDLEDRVKNLEFMLIQYGAKAVSKSE